MNVVATWIRRSLAAPLCLGIFCFLGWGIWSNPFWSSDATWGAQYVGASSVLFAPLIAAAAAYEMSVRHAPGFMEACSAARRGTRGAFVPVVATLICVLLTFGAAVFCVWIVASRAGGLTRIDPWVGIEMLAAYAAACFVGAGVGVVGGRRSAPLLAALIVLATPVVLGFLSSPLAAAQFSVAHSDGTSLGLQRVRGSALAAVATHLAYCLASLMVILWAKRVRPWRPTWWVPAALIVVGAVVTQWMTLPREGSFEPSEEAQVCIGQAPTVCGPARGEPIFASVQLQLAAAALTLDGRGYIAPRKFIYARGGVDGWSDNSAKLDFNTEDFRLGRLPAEVVAQNMSAPKACAGFFGAGDARVIEAQGEVRAWILDVLEGRFVGQIPPGVEAASKIVATCRTIPAG